MSEEKENLALYDKLFVVHVLELTQLAMMQLGKIANPMTQKIEKNLDAAKHCIDTLCMLREKSKGNLSKEEEGFLNENISTLQMNYVDECKDSSK